jgi:hypothetical protein
MMWAYGALIFAAGFAAGFFTLWHLAMPDFNRMSAQLEAMGYVWVNGKHVKLTAPRSPHPSA